MIAKMKKLTLAAAKSDIDKISNELLWLSSVEILPLTKLLSSIEEKSNVGACVGAELNKAESDFNLIRNSIEILSVVDDAKKALFSIPTCFNRVEFQSLSEKFYKALEIAKEISEISKNITLKKSELNKISSDISSLEPFMKLDIPISLEKTKSTYIFKGTFPITENADSINEFLMSNEYDADCVYLGEHSALSFFLIFAHEKCADDVISSLNTRGFQIINIKNYEKSAKDESIELLSSLQNCEKELQILNDSLKSRILQTEELKFAYDYSQFKIEILKIKEKLYSTESTYILQGFIPQNKLKLLSDKLQNFDCYYETNDPCEDEEVPTHMVNNKFATPFESIISLYSLPAYNGFDPTFIMSVFYFVIFGLIMQDVGYGLLLFIGCTAFAKLSHAKGTMKKMLNMFALCGISTIICGILFGGYFGDLPSAIATNIFGIKDFPDLSLLFNPIANPIGYLILSLVCGVVHLVTGMLIKAYMLFKEGKPFDAVCDVFTWLLLFLGIGLIFINPQIGKVVAIAGLLSLILTQGRKEKNIVMKFLKGIMSLYDSISYLSDLLSYSRIMALGLSGAIIGQVVNLMGTMGGASIGGFIALVISFFLGHALNLALSVLGAFVHTARLQYIEFFNKFYIDGGIEFNPSRIKTKYIEINLQEEI